MTINERIKKIRFEFCNDSNIEFAKIMGESRQAVNNWVRNGYSVGNGVLYRILEKFDQVSNSWLLKGEGNMLKSGSIISSEKNLIPFYDDVASIGGTNELIADTKGASIPSEYIDTGDWFRNATAAIRHYGDSMIEYPPGCILALKEVKERQLIIWGKDYVVETNEYRITKCVQRGFDKEHITAYSSNTETYPDGRLKHEPTDIAWKDISRIFLVLGYVVKKNGGTIVFSNQKQN